MVAARRRRLVVRAAGAELDAMHESESVGVSSAR